MRVCLCVDRRIHSKQDTMGSLATLAAVADTCASQHRPIAYDVEDACVRACEDACVRACAHAIGSCDSAAVSTADSAAVSTADSAADVCADPTRRYRP
jgi:hypothetical protein